jgi:alpha-beta hydrolase superfamily lysophospholipase
VVRVVGVGLAVGFGLLNVLAYNHAYAMTHYTAEGSKTGKPEHLSALGTLKVLVCGVRVTRPVSDKKPSALAPPCEALTLAATDGGSLSAWLCERGPATPLVIVFHGYAAEKTKLLPEAKAFLELGASVLLVDFRGAGGSSGSATTIGVREADDVATVVRYARERLPHASTVLFGQSMGAVAILRAASERTVAPGAVILEAAFDTLLNTVRNRFSSMHVASFPSAELLVLWGGMQCGFNGFTHNPVGYAKALTCPALFMHGAQDLRVSVEESRRVFAAAPEPKVYREFEGVGHESFVTKCPDEWKGEVKKFLATLPALKTAASARHGRAVCVSL